PHPRFVSSDENVKRSVADKGLPGCHFHCSVLRRLLTRSPCGSLDHCLDHEHSAFLDRYRPWKQGNIAGRTGVPPVHPLARNVSDVMTTMKTAAMNAANATSSTAVPRRSFMDRIKGKCRLLSIRIGASARVE